MPRPPGRRRVPSHHSSTITSASLSQRIAQRARQIREHVARRIVANSIRRISITRSATPQPTLDISSTGSTMAEAPSTRHHPEVRTAEAGCLPPFNPMVSYSAFGILCLHSTKYANLAEHSIGSRKESMHRRLLNLNTRAAAKEEKFLFRLLKTHQNHYIRCLLLLRVRHPLTRMLN
jgi:hypothetical protein